jgi:1-acyl-sn-glycerol-3-phosphate acyltransferase
VSTPLVPPLPPALPRRDSAALRWVGRVGLRLLRWRADGGFPNVPKLVLCVAPHTSNWDFFVGIFIDFALDIRAHWLGKNTMFRWPIARLLKRLGGIPIFRSEKHNMVEQCVVAFSSADALVLAIAPEGTRKKVKEWRTGFWHIAREAHIPILLVSFDYEHRVVTFGPMVTPSDSLAEDLAMMKAHFAPIKGRNPDQF